MPPPSEDTIIDEADYISEEDSDFAPDQAAGDDNVSESASDNEGAEAVDAGAKRKATGNADNAEDGFENSGGEAIIKKGHKKRKKKAHCEDEDGEGGLVKTRAQRAAEKEDRKVSAPSGPVTIDVDALFANMMAGKFGTPTVPEPTEAPQPTTETPTSSIPTTTTQPTASTPSTVEPETILIKRKYNFAGKVHTEQKLVPRSSAEAQLYLSSLTPEEAAVVLAAAGISSEDKSSEAPERAPRKAFRSRFEPPIELVTRRADLQLSVALRLQAREDAKAKAKAKKLNTVEKSRMDWAGYVDKEGLKDELVLAGKAKGSFAERQDFLARTEAKREQDARKARMAARAQEQKV